MLVHVLGRVCGGKSGTNWRAHGLGTLRISVDTSACSFHKTPQYVASLTGDDSEAANLLGSYVISNATKWGFVLLMAHRELRGARLLQASHTHKWRSSWIADDGYHSGITAGHGLTRNVKWGTTTPDGVLYADVDTTKCNYASIPHIFTAVRDVASFSESPRSVRLVEGAHIVYDVTRTSFRVYFFNTVCA